MRSTKVEFLYWEGCPSHPEAWAVLQSALAASGVEATVERRLISSQAEAEEHRFPGSPTIRVNGTDVDPAGTGGRAYLSCRIYLLPDGRVSPVPSRAQIEAALGVL